MNKYEPPKARKDGLIIKELADETLIYDLETDQAHCLNQTAAQIWQYCDGQRTIADLTNLLAKETNSPVTDEVVWLALDQLKKFRLLANDAPSAPFHLQGLSRRELVRRMGFATLALPLIVSISAGSAEAQGSLLPPGRCCGNPNECASNSCSQNPTCTSPPAPAPSTKACN